MTEATRKFVKMNDFANKKVKAFADCVENVKSLTTLNKDKISAVYFESILQAEKLRIQKSLLDFEEKKQDLESKHETFQSNYETAKVAAKKARQEANLLNNLDSNESNARLEELLKSDEYKTNFAKFPDDINQIEMDLAQAEAIQRCSSSIDESLMKTYEMRSKRIEKLKVDHQKMGSKLCDHQNNYETSKNEWLEKVETMINELDKKFSALFMLLKCAGEVVLARPDNLEDFAKYGICIKVSFRCDEEKQELTGWKQRLIVVFINI